MLESNNETAGFTFALSLWAWRDWAELKLASGELQRVEELTKLQTALARDAYESTAATYGKTSTLFDAVKFQARILLLLGSFGEACLAQKESEMLRDIVKTCKGLREGVVRNVD